MPILIVAAGVIIKKRSSIYFPLFLAFGTATLIKVALVVHEYFPSKYFKYILIGGLLIVVARLLIYFIRTIAFPKTQWLVKQYREAYERRSVDREEPERFANNQVEDIRRGPAESSPEALAKGKRKGRPEESSPPLVARSRRPKRIMNRQQE